MMAYSVRLSSGEEFTMLSPDCEGDAQKSVRERFCDDLATVKARAAYHNGEKQFWWDE